MTRPPVRIIATQDSRLIPPSVIDCYPEEAKKLIRSLNIRRITEYDLVDRHVLRIEYDSILVGAAFTFETRLW
jgi:hypothetical protein